MDYSPDFNTTIPKRLGLPTLPKGAGSNPSEGVVVRPAAIEEILRLESGTVMRTRGSRKMYKIKAETFAEIAYGKKKEHAMSVQKGGGGKRSAPHSKLSLVEQLWAEAARRINAARVDSAVSKTGPILSKASPEEQREKMQEIRALVYEDLVEELAVMGLGMLDSASYHKFWGRVKRKLDPIIVDRASRTVRATGGGDEE